MRPVASTAFAVRPRRNPILRLFTSVWFGVALLALMFTYGSFMSAYAPARWATEMTDMMVFRHWFFVTLAALFCVSLVAITLFRTPWRLVNLGSHMSHVGLLLLVGGAFAYFGTKIEGDVLVESPQIVLRAKFGEAQFPAYPGSSWSMPMPTTGEPLKLTVLDMKARGVQPAATATVSVQNGNSPARTLTLTDRPEDWQSVAEGLEVQLANSPAQSAFYDDEHPVLYVRGPEGGEYVKAIKHLPINRARYLPDEGVLHDARGRDVPSWRTTPTIRALGMPIPTGWFERWRMPIEVDSEGLPFSITITGYAPIVNSVQPRQMADGTTWDEPVVEHREPPSGSRSSSGIRLKLTGRGPYAGWSETRWCMFSMYPDFVETRPIHVHLPKATTPWEITYSRARHDLGATIAATKLFVTYQPGQRKIDTFHSELLLQSADGVVRPTNVSTNETIRVGHWTLYQSGFDGQQHWRWSILGVGNRTGMWAMNSGWITVAAGCLFAFYIKPLLVRRQKERLGELDGELAAAGVEK